MVSIRTALACFLLCSLWPAAPYALQPQPAKLPVDPGEAVATCFSGLVNNSNSSFGLKAGPNDFVVGFADVSDPQADGVVPGQNWPASMFHNELANQSGLPDPAQTWNAKNLGQVFGITLDDAHPANIYITATTTYGLYKTSSQFVTGMFGPGGPGAVYRLDGTDGKISTFAVLPKAGIGSGPNSGPGLGDIAFDRANQQFFVTEFDSGLIYRLAGVGHVSGSAPGTILDTYDHGAINLALGLDTSGDMAATFSSANKTVSSGFAPLGRRPWAAQVFGGRLFYSIWANDSRTLPPAQNGAPNEIWSVPIDPVTGGFVTTTGAAKKEISLSRPLTKGSGANYSNPVSDIAFSSAGRMLVAERTMSNGDVGPDLVTSGIVGHRARVLEFQGGTGNWGPGQIFHVGVPSGFVSNARANSEGGIDYGYEIFNYPPGTPAESRACDQSVWATAEQILQTPFVYGLQGIRASGNSVTSVFTDFAVDLNGIFTTQDKARIGDVEVARHSCFENCLRIADVRIRCVADGSGDVVVTFQFTNQTSGPIHHLFIANLPAGVTTTDDHFSFTTPVAANGGTATVGPIRIHNAPPGPLSFTISIHDANLVECCATDVTIEIPACDCGQILEDGNACILLPQTHFQYTFTFQNLFQQFSAPHVFVIPVSPANITVSPNVFPASPPLQYGDLLTGTTTISGLGAVPGQKVCLRISTHDAEFRECCAIDRCFTLTSSCEFGPFDDFDINIVWRDSKGKTGTGQAVRLTDDSAYFWFFDPENVELVVKILDGRAINGKWWFFYGALSNVEYTITLRDKKTGASKTYFNPAGRFASVGDTAALPGSTSSISSVQTALVPAELPIALGSVAGPCTAEPTSLCLKEGRFKVEVTWQDSTGHSGLGHAVPLNSNTGYFWFFDVNNIELMLKVLDGRALNDHWWVFYASLSNVQYTIRVTDTVTGTVKTYFNPAGNFASVGDTAAF
jgi:hypothetical protein